MSQRVTELSNEELLDQTIKAGIELFVAGTQDRWECAKSKIDPLRGELLRRLNQSTASHSDQ